MMESQSDGRPGQRTNPCTGLLPSTGTWMELTFLADSLTELSVFAQWCIYDEAALENNKTHVNSNLEACYRVFGFSITLSVSALPRSSKVPSGLNVGIDEKV